MKGTITRGKSLEEDKILLQNILADEKTKAENLMIVDLLRNDIGVIADKASVKVESMLDIETHKTLHQLTSTIKANISKIDYYKIFKALFPCGSVTGAPKLETMRIISELETGERGVYCGAIGYISPYQKSVFSVPIRILQKHFLIEDICSKKKSIGNRVSLQKMELEMKDIKWIYRVGSGIVWDSKPKDEWKENNLKTQFVRQAEATNFNIFETMLLKDGRIIFEKQHLDRMQKSASFFGFKFNREQIKEQIKDYVVTQDIIARSSKQHSNTHKNLDGCSTKLASSLAMIKGNKALVSTHSSLILRMDLTKKGDITFSKRKFEESKKNLVTLSDIILDSKNIFLRYKTTYRTWYNKTIEQIQKNVLYDEIFLNEFSEVCEGSRNNIFVEIDGILYTPSLDSGVLDGILRQDLINKGKCVEKKLYLEDLQVSQNIYFGNSVRGLKKVKVFIKNLYC